MKKLLKWTGAALALLSALLVLNTLRVKPAPKAPPATDLIAVDEGAAAERLAGALRIPTVTHNERSKVDWTQWPRLHAYVAEQFPNVHRQLKRETVAQYSLLYTWEGRDPAARPILLLAHQDVVPVEPGTETTWAHPPFSGDIAEGYIWGRGALDDKASLLGQLEAAELLLASGFQPARTIYFAFGHDEEIGGQEGAAALAALLEKRGIKAEFSLDEGGLITLGVMAGIQRPVASIMTAEKGYVSFKLGTRDAGGHSSRPGRATAIGRLAQAVSNLERRWMAPRLTPPVSDMLDRLAPEMSFGRRLLVANRWLFGPLIARQMATGRISNALVRTTTAPTIFRAGVKDNVLPVEAGAVVNFRVLPGETLDELEQRVRDIVDDPEVEIVREDFASEPSAPAGTDTPAFALLERTVAEVFPEAIVTAGLVIGATDNRHYGAVFESRYNFLPVTIREEDLSRVHGANERISLPDYRRAVQFYARLLQNAAGP